MLEDCAAEGFATIEAAVVGACCATGLAAAAVAVVVVVVDVVASIVELVGAVAEVGGATLLLLLLLGMEGALVGGTGMTGAWAVVFSFLRELSTLKVNSACMSDAFFSSLDLFLKFNLR